MECILETQGYTAKFDFQPSGDPVCEFVLVTEFVLHRELGNVAVRSGPAHVSDEEVGRLIRYFEEHIATLATQPGHDSFEFVTYGLTFTLRAGAGIMTEGTPYFDLLFMVTVDPGDYVMVGGDCGVLVSEVRSFLDALRRVRAELR